MPTALRQNWWAIAIRGLAAIVFGILALVEPGITVAVLVLWFGAWALVDGVFNIIAAWRSPEMGARWGTLLAEGIIGVIAGILAFAWPFAAAFALVYLIGAWAVITGILEISAAIRLRRVITGEWALILMGIVSVLFGIVLFISPVIGALVIAMWIGAYALIFGILLLVLAFRMRHWEHLHLAGPELRPA